MNHALVSICIAFAASLGFGVRASATPIYHLIDLALPEWNISWSTGMNSSGQVTVHSNFNGKTLAYLYSGGTLTQLPLGTAKQGANAAGINDSGQIAGTYVTTNLIARAMTYSNGTLTDLGALPSNLNSGGLAINNLGQVAGYGFTSNGNPLAAVYSNGVFQSIGSFGSNFSAATGINNLGQVVGYSNTTTDGGAGHFFLYDGTMHDLGRGTATGINDSGQIIGNTIVVLGGAAFVYSGGVTHLLGTLQPSDTASFAHGIDSKGDIVGNSGTHVFDYTNASGHGFLYTSGKMYDLNSLLDSSKLHWTVNDGTAINDSGWIAGEGFYSVNDNTTGVYHPILLIPVPEPGGLPLLVVGGLTALAWTILRAEKNCASNVGR